MVLTSYLVGGENHSDISPAGETPDNAVGGGLVYLGGAVGNGVGLGVGDGPLLGFSVAETGTLLLGGSCISGGSSWSSPLLRLAGKLLECTSCWGVNISGERTLVPPFIPDTGFP